MQPAELHKHLRKKKMHAVVMAQIEDEVLAIKETKRKERISRTVRQQAWLELLQPLRYELHSARAGRNYIVRGSTGAPQRREAFDAYIKVMEKLLAKFEVPSTQLDTIPSQMAKEKNASGKGSPIPNNGIHWTDWIPAHIKMAVSDAFNALPYKPKAKRKVPFPRTVLPTLHSKRKMQLLKRTHTELANAERIFTLNPTQDTAMLIDRIKKAIEIIGELDDKDVVPHTWHGVLNF
jgi:hypothetical protein